ncbi:MAG: hypothetical protein WC760_07425 [Bacteroidia bacterium]|jgi:hypothetical protein
MNKITYTGLIAFMLLASCGNNEPKQLNTEEQAAVEKQVHDDQAAMDSLEQAIQAQINEADTIE